MSEYTEYLNNLKVGDTVYVDGASSFCTTGDEKVTKIKTRYDKKTGVPYRVIHTESQKFDGRDGCGPGNSMYYIGWDDKDAKV